MLGRLADFFCAEHCRGCHELVPTTSLARTLCAGCWEAVTAAPPIYELVELDDNRALPVAAGTTYDGIVKKMIYHLKYDNDRLVTEDLAAILKDGFAELDGDIGDKSCLLVPIPLHWQRRYKRRYNQAELLTREMLRQLAGSESRSGTRNGTRSGIRKGKQNAFPQLRGDLLTRGRKTRSHYRLSREERVENVKDAFVVHNKSLVLADHAVVIVDDIYTSGATLAEAARSLLNAGAKQILGLSVARALLRNPL